MMYIKQLAARSASSSMWSFVKQLNCSTSNDKYITPKLILKKPQRDERTNKMMYTPTVVEGKHKVLPAQHIPPSIQRPSYVLSNIRELQFPHKHIYGEVKTSDEIECMKQAATLAARCLKMAMQHSDAGVSTDEIDGLVHDFIITNNAYPSAVQFHGFPKSLCASPNEVACHGIPDTRPLEDGDLVSYDCTVYLNGFHGDCAGTVEVGNTSEADKELNRIAKESLMVAIDVVKAGTRVSDIGRAIEEFVESNGYSVIKEFCGHFIGRDMHMFPLIPHAYDVANDTILKAGNILTIEPVICQGSGELRTWDDGWTVVTCDNGKCAQWEHTILVTDTGSEILTLP